MSDMTNHEIALYVLFAILLVLLSIHHVRNAHTVNDLTWDRERDKAEYRAAVCRREKQIESLERRLAALEKRTPPLPADGIAEQLATYQQDRQLTRPVALAHDVQTSTGSYLPNAVSAHRCCAKTRLVGAGCPAGRVCPHA